MEAKEQLSLLTSGVLEILRENGYKPSCIKRYSITWEYLQAYMVVKGMPLYDRFIGESYLNNRFDVKDHQELTRPQKEKVRHIAVLTDFLEHGFIRKRRFMITPIVFVGLLGEPFNQFIEYARSTMRTESTISRYRDRINTLYEHLAATNNQVKDITAQNLIQYVKQVNEKKNSIDRNNTIMTIRVFFRYLCSSNLLQNNREEYWMSLLKCRNIYQPKIQSVYTQEEVNALINTINRGCPQGKRDYAMILLAARYGLRVSDIVGMRHCNLDWEHNNIVVIQLKTSKKVVLPLSEEVGNAIIEYLKYGRPDIDLPYIFITAHAPYGQTTCTGMNRTISDYFRLAGVSFKDRKHGPHALRHSLASNLLKSNESLPVISEILGHSTSESTMSYLRVDMKLLKQCTLDVPCVPSSFYDNLYDQQEF